MCPFDRDCLRTDDLISVEELRGILDVVVSELEGHYAEQPLYTVDDWHQHDGYITQRRMTDCGLWQRFAKVHSP